jgi:hypothetical protein
MRDRSRSEVSRVLLLYVYTNNRTGSCIFYAISAAENMLVYGDVSNAFAEARPPKQGFFIYPDRAFHDWWVNKKGKPPIPPCYPCPWRYAGTPRISTPLGEKYRSNPM